MLHISNFYFVDEILPESGHAAPEGLLVSTFLGITIPMHDVTYYWGAKFCSVILNKLLGYWGISWYIIYQKKHQKNQGTTKFVQSFRSASRSLSTSQTESSLFWQTFWFWIPSAKKVLHSERTCAFSEQSFWSFSTFFRWSKWWKKNWAMPNAFHLEKSSAIPWNSNLGANKVQKLVQLQEIPNWNPPCNREHRAEENPSLQFGPKKVEKKHLEKLCPTMSHLTNDFVARIQLVVVFLSIRAGIFVPWPDLGCFKSLRRKILGNFLRIHRMKYHLQIECGRLNIWSETTSTDRAKV